MVVFAVAWLNLKVFQRGRRKQHKHVYSFLVPYCWITLNLNQAETYHLLPIIPIDIVAYAFTVLWDNLCWNSCVWNNSYLNCGGRLKWRMIITVNFSVQAIGKKKPEEKNQGFNMIHTRDPVCRVRQVHARDVNVKCILNWPLPIGAFQDHCKQR